MDELQAALLLEVETFLAAQKIGPGSFGARAVNDAKLVDRLRNPSMTITFRTAAKIREFMAREEVLCEVKKFLATHSTPFKAAAEIREFLNQYNSGAA